MTRADACHFEPDAWRYATENKKYMEILKNLNLLDKLIVEHGSAVVFKDHIALLKEQMLIIDSEKKDLQIQNKDLEIKIKELEREIFIEKEKNKTLQNKIDQIHSLELSEKHTNVLLAVATYSGEHAGFLASVLKISEHEANSKLNYLSSLGLLHYDHGILKNADKPNSFGRAVNRWFVSRPGHAYIKSHNLNDKIA